MFSSAPPEILQFDAISFTVLPALIAPHDQKFVRVDLFVVPSADVSFDEQDFILAFAHSSPRSSFDHRDHIL
jgi:hypothetical protein